MSRDLVNPIAGVVAAARNALPQITGATARAQERMSRPRRKVILADVSSSMAERAGSRRKIDVLADALATAPDQATLVAFSSHVTPVRSAKMLPAPSGGTALHLALDHAHALEATHVLVISDGHPDDPSAALTVADRLDARIDVVYCGPDNDASGMAFMSRLARNGGAAHHRNAASQQFLTDTRRLMIEGPC
jgi:uncharacterized protein with von Willebrand factor type A (vWA) domain